MPRQTRESEQTGLFHVSFPRTRKRKEKERKTFCKKLQSLLERDTDSLSIKDISFEKKKITMETVDFGSLIDFTRPVRLHIIVSKDLEKNRTRVNDLANKLVNYLNTIMGESAENPRVSANFVVSVKKAANLARIFVEETRLAKINELTKKTLNVRGIFFDYKSDDHENLVVHLYSEEEGAIALIYSKCRYKGIIPWDFVLGEYNNLKETTNMLGKLAQKEF